MLIKTKKSPFTKKTFDQKLLCQIIVQQLFLMCCAFYTPGSQYSD